MASHLALPQGLNVWRGRLDATTRAQFEAMGWTPDAWVAMDEDLDRQGFVVTVNARLHRGAGLEGNVREWLWFPPDTFVNPVSPALFRQTVTGYDWIAASVLDAYAAGATVRFITSVYTTGSFAVRARTAWTIAQLAHLGEPDATGWAVTGLLAVGRPPARVEPAQVVADRITTWTDRLGPTSWLYVLAGFTLDEAIALKDADQSPTGQQLRVMAALNGHTLPEGI